MQCEIHVGDSLVMYVKSGWEYCKKRDFKTLKSSVGVIRSIA
jgi:hypothetical protein